MTISFYDLRATVGSTEPLATLHGHKVGLPAAHWVSACHLSFLPALSSPASLLRLPSPFPAPCSSCAPCHSAPRVAPLCASLALLHARLCAQGMVTALAECEATGALVSASRDATVVLWDPRQQGSIGPARRGTTWNDGGRGEAGAHVGHRERELSGVHMTSLFGLGGSLNGRLVFDNVAVGYR